MEFKNNKKIRTIENNNLENINIIYQNNTLYNITVIVNWVSVRVHSSSGYLELGIFGENREKEIIYNTVDSSTNNINQRITLEPGEIFGYESINDISVAVTFSYIKFVEPENSPISIEE